MGPNLLAVFCSVLLAHRSLQSASAAPPTPAATPPVVFGATFEGYYAWNANRPPGGNNAFRGYDVKTDSFAIQQVAVVVDAPPAVADGRRPWPPRRPAVQRASGRSRAIPPTRAPGRTCIATCSKRTARTSLPVSRGLTMDFPTVASPWASRRTTPRTTTASARPARLPAVLPPRARGSRRPERPGHGLLHGDQRRTANGRLQLDGGQSRDGRGQTAATSALYG